MARPPTPEPFRITRSGLVVPVRIDEDGRRGPTTAQARGPRWRRTSHGYYVPATVDDGFVDQRIVEAAAILPAFGAVTGWAALRWLGGVWFDGTLDGVVRRPVTLATSCADVRPQPGIQISAEGLDPQEIVVVDGLRVTLPARSVCFEMRYATDLVGAVTALDMATYSDVVSVSEATAYALAHSGWTGIPQCRDATYLSEENAWSPAETPMRLTWKRVMPRAELLCNHPIFDVHGRHLGTPDLFDPAVGVVGEYEGALHLEGRQRSHDLDREATFRAHGLEYVTMVAGDRPDASRFVVRLHGAYGRAAMHSSVRRAWTVDLPPWWTDTSTVDLRRALSTSQRARLLRYRSG